MPTNLLLKADVAVGVAGGEVVNDFGSFVVTLIVRHDDPSRWSVDDLKSAGCRGESMAQL